MLEVYK